MVKVNLDKDKVKVKAKVKVKDRARARAMEARAMEAMETKGAAKAVIVILFRIDDEPCMLIWVYFMTYHS
jgi:hypothetical protein